jgi:hypothetical protein
MCDIPASGPVDHGTEEVPVVRRIIVATRRLEPTATQSLAKATRPLALTYSSATPEETLLKSPWSTQTLYSKETVMKNFNEVHAEMQLSNTVFFEELKTFHASEMSGAQRRHDDILEEIYVKKKLEDSEIINELNRMKAENKSLKETLKRGLETRSCLEVELIEVNKKLKYTHGCYDNAEERNMNSKMIEKFERIVRQKTSLNQSPGNAPIQRKATLINSKQIQQLEEVNTKLVDINQTQTVELKSLRETHAYSEARDEHILGGICDSIATMLDLNEGPEYVVKKKICGISGFLGWFSPP